jgi:TRAP-type uncharacterized transport system fused permease subunit
MQIHFRARKLGMVGVPREQLPNLWRILKKKGHLLIPVATLVYFLLNDYSTTRVAFLAIVATAGLSFFYSPYDPNRMNMAKRFQSPGAEYLLGTDQYGRRHPEPGHERGGEFAHRGLGGGGNRDGVWGLLRFLAAFDDEASKANEQNVLTIQGQGVRVVVKQIAGLIARRVVCWKQAGQRMERGEVIGLIRFGSI